MKKVERGSVVCCPKCGTAASVSEIELGSHVCKNCGTKFGGFVMDAFVLTFEWGPEEQDYMERLEHFERCRSKMIAFKTLETA